MHLEGSCHCGAVRFALESDEPIPFLRCYCSICRKTAGGGGYAINLGGDAHSLKVVGLDHIRSYRACLKDAETGTESVSEAERKFCGECGSALWVWDPRWPELIHPHASAIDTPLPVPPQRTHMMLGSKPDWVQADVRDGDESFEEYPEESLAEWHRRHRTQA